MRSSSWRKQAEGDRRLWALKEAGRRLGQDLSVWLDIQDLYLGKIHAQPAFSQNSHLLGDLPPLEVVIVDWKVLSLSNRRLTVLKMGTPELGYGVGRSSVTMTEPQAMMWRGMAV